MNLQSLRTESGLTFHDVIYRAHSSGIKLAFVVCKDGVHKKYYWGLVKTEDEPRQILHIMASGAKWKGTNDEGDILL